MLRGPRCALLRVASYHDGLFACPACGIAHLIIGDFPVLGLVGGQEVIQGLQAPVVIGLEPKSVIDPGAYALSVTTGNGLLGHRH